MYSARMPNRTTDTPLPELQAQSGRRRLPCAESESMAPVIAAEETVAAPAVPVAAPVVALVAEASAAAVSPEFQAAVAKAHAAHPGIGSKALVKHLRDRGWEVDNKKVKAAIEAVLALALALYTVRGPSPPNCCAQTPHHCRSHCAQHREQAKPEPTESEPGEKHECTYCGIVCSTLKCGKCVELQVAVPARYCSTECQEAHWPAHRLWHRKLKDLKHLNEAANETSARHQTAREMEEDARSGGEMAKLLAKSGRYMDQQNYRKSVKALQEALALDPTEPAALHNLAVTFSRSNNRPEAAKYALLAARWSEARGGRAAMAPWARSWGMACALLLKPECANVPRPAWWNDKALLQLTERVVRLIPNEAEIDIWHTRAQVLSAGSHMSWKPEVRTLAQLKEAVRCLKRQAELIPYMAPPLLHNAAVVQRRCDVLEMAGIDPEALWRKMQGL